MYFFNKLKPYLECSHKITTIKFEFKQACLITKLYDRAWHTRFIFISYNYIC